MSVEAATNPVVGSEALSDAGVADQTLVGGENLDLGSNDGGDAGGAEEEVEDYEHDGKAFKLPKAIAEAMKADKAERLMHADYTRKTQEVAEAKRVWDAERAQQTQLDVDHRKLLGVTAAIDAQLDQFGKVDWTAWSQTDPAAANAAFMRYQSLKDAKSEADKAITDHESQRALQAESARTTQLQEAHAVLAKEIPDWDKPETKATILSYGTSLGFTAQELSQVTDPRMIRVLYLAQSNAAKATQAAKVDRIAAGQTTTPAPTTKGGGGGQFGAADTDDFAAFERLADAKLSKKKA